MMLFFKDILTLENETTMLSQNVGHQSPSEMVPHPNRMLTTSYSTAGGGRKYEYGA
jgi:hypothetical protein